MMALQGSRFRHVLQEVGEVPRGLLKLRRRQLARLRQHKLFYRGILTGLGRVRTVPVSDVTAGDKVVSGASGVRVVPLPAIDRSAGSA